MDNPEKTGNIGYTRRRQTNRNTTTYVLDTTIHKTQDTRRRQTKQKHNTICVGHHYT